MVGIWSAQREDMETGRPEMKVNKERGRRRKRKEVDLERVVVVGGRQAAGCVEVRGMYMLVNHNQ